MPNQPFLPKGSLRKKIGAFFDSRSQRGRGGGVQLSVLTPKCQKKTFLRVFLYWQNPLKNKIWLPSWRLLALRRSLCNQIQLKQTWFFKPYRCVQGWRISIAKLSSKDKLYYKLLGGMSLQFWGSSAETLKNGEIPNTPSPPPSNANMQLTGC